jgi:dihydrofolate reductase
MARWPVHSEGRRSCLKQHDGGDLLVYGHGLLARSLLRAKLLDVLDVSIHPVIAGSGRLLFSEDQAAAMKLVATKTFSNIVKLTTNPSIRQRDHRDDGHPRDNQPTRSRADVESRPG